jgi:putative transposase
MSNLAYKPDYQKNLPHIQPPGATLFVTCRLAGSLPKAVLDRLQEEAEAAKKQALTLATAEQGDQLYWAQRHAFGRFDAALDRADRGPTWLKQPAIAKIAVESLHFLNGDLYDLDHFSVMSNHVHITFTPLRDKDGKYIGLQRIMHAFKRYTAREANKILQREGQFWQHESYDHVVRDEAELDRIRQYVLNNPVKAGLVDEPQVWPYSWAKWW